MANGQGVQSVRLPDDRDLAYAEYGDVDGPAVIFLHGTPGSRLDGMLLPLQLGARVIAPDRPGFGRSVARSERTLRGWSMDVAGLADALDLGRFAILGLSGGGPHALACAAFLGRRVSCVGIVCGLGPLDRPGSTDGMHPANVAIFEAARNNPEQVETMLGVMTAAITADPLAMVEQMTAVLPAHDRAFLARPEIRAAIPDVLLEGFRQGPSAAMQELVMLTRSWGFRLEDIDGEVFVWQGDLDANVPASHARYLASTIPGAHLEILPDEGHYSMLDHVPRFLAAITGG